MIRIDLFRLEQMKLVHSRKVEAYRSMCEARTKVALSAARARADAPPLPAGAKVKKDGFYLLPLATLRSFSDVELDSFGVDRRALNRILVAESTLESLKVDSAAQSKSVTESAQFIENMDAYAKQNSY